MNEVITKTDSTANSGLMASARMGDYTGILPSQKIEEMLSSGEISTTQLKQFDHDQVQPASIDLRLGDYACPVDTSFLPGKGTKVLDKMKQLDDRFADFKIDLKDGAVLEKGRVYVIPLLEAINLRGSSRNRVGKFHVFQSAGSMDVSIFSRRYSSSRRPYARRWITRILLLSPSTKPSETLFSGLQYAAMPSQ